MSVCNILVNFQQKAFYCKFKHLIIIFVNVAGTTTKVQNTEFTASSTEKVTTVTYEAG